MNLLVVGTSARQPRTSALLAEAAGSFAKSGNSWLVPEIVVDDAELRLSMRSQVRLGLLGEVDVWSNPLDGLGRSPSDG